MQDQPQFASGDGGFSTEAEVWSSVIMLRFERVYIGFRPQPRFM